MCSECPGKPGNTPMMGPNLRVSDSVVLVGLVGGVGKNLHFYSIPRSG